VAHPASAVRDDGGVSRHLVLVRHAKSAWDDPSLSDHDRPLAPRGTKALPRLRDHLARATRPAELVLCSSSRRTVDTFDGIRSAVSPRARVEMDRAIYDADADTLLAQLHHVDDDIAWAMLIGHNPAIQQLAVFLVGAGDTDTRAQLCAKLPTGSAVSLSFDGGWGGLGAGTARLDDLFMPRPPR